MGKIFATYLTDRIITQLGHPLMASKVLVGASRRKSPEVTRVWMPHASAGV